MTLLIREDVNLLKGIFLVEEMSKFWVNEQMSKCVGWDFPPFPGFLTKIHTFLTEIKKENSSSIFDIAVNENLLYLKIWSPFQPPLPKVILYPGNLDACPWNGLAMP